MTKPIGTSPTDSLRELPRAAPTDAPTSPPQAAEVLDGLEAAPTGTSRGTPAPQYSLAPPGASGVTLRTASATKAEPLAPFPGADYPHLGELADPSGEKFQVFYEFGYRNNNGTLPGLRHDDGLTFGFEQRLVFFSPTTKRSYGVELDAHAYIGTYRPGEYARDRPRTDAVALRALVGQEWQLGETVRLNGEAYAGVLAEGRLGMRNIQNGFHKSINQGRTGERLTDNYPNEMAKAALVGGKVSVTHDVGNLSLTGGAKLDLALGNTGVNRVGPFGEVAYRLGDSGFQVALFGEARYQKVNGGRLQMHNAGHVSDAVNVNVGARVAYQNEFMRISWSVESDHAGSTRGLDRAALGNRWATPVTALLTVGFIF